MAWLQRHDREAGGLYGALPLCIGMPVAATDHLDRERGVLRGCSGRVCGWTHDIPTAEPSKQDGEVRFWTKLPTAVYVRFKTKRQWHVQGIANDCVLPAAPVRSVWHLDHRRKHPKLKVSRRQLPLCPYFAITAHAGQGLTVREGAIADIAIRASDDPLTCYVAVTRVEGRERLLIFRPFALAPFQRGEDVGRNLLLRVWRGEAIDWKRTRQEYIIEKPCSECRERKEPRGYTARQWKQEETSRVCEECIGRHEQAGHPWQCRSCKCWLPTSAFHAKWHQTRTALLRVCSNCKETKTCYNCQRKKEESEYSTAAWRTTKAERQKCKACSQKQRGFWMCAQCGVARPQKCFARYTRRCGGAKTDGKQTCNACAAEQDLQKIACRSKMRLGRTREKRKKKILAEVWRLVAAMRDTGAGAKDN